MLGNDGHPNVVAALSARLSGSEAPLADTAKIRRKSPLALLPGLDPGIGGSLPLPARGERVGVRGWITAAGSRAERGCAGSEGRNLDLTA